MARRIKTRFFCAKKQKKSVDILCNAQYYVMGGTYERTIEKRLVGNLRFGGR